MFSVGEVLDNIKTSEGLLEVTYNMKLMVVVLKEDGLT